MAEEEIGARLKLKDRQQFSDDAKGAADDVEGIGKAADRADKAGRKMGSGMGVASAGIRGVMGVAKAGAVAVGALAVGVGALGVKTVGLAMDAAETESAFNTVFAGMEKQVGSFVKTMNADYGIPTAELQDAARQFGVFGKAAGVPAKELADFSTSLTQASLDLGSFYNADPAEVFQAMQSGLAGETEAMRRFGIFMSDASLNAFALKQGINKTTQEMTEGEKVALRQQFILANMGDAQGDLARTSEGLANQWRGLKGRLTEAGTAIGTALLPYANDLVHVINDRMQPAVAWLQNGLPVAVGKVESVVAGAGARIKSAWDKGGSIGGFAEQATGIEGIAGPVNRVADAFRDVWKIITVGIVPAFMDVQSQLPGVAQPLNLIDSALDFISDHASTLRPLLVGLVAGFVAWRLTMIASNGVIAVNTALTNVQGGAIKKFIVQSRIAKAATIVWTGVQWALNSALFANPIGLVVLAIVALVAIFVIAYKKSETFRNIVNGAFNSVKNAAGVAKDWIVQKWNAVIDFFQAAPGKIRSAASNMWDGIKDAFRGVINWVIDAWNSIDFSVNVSIPSWVPGLGGKGWQSGDIVPDIPRLHTGGTTTRGGAAIIQPDEEMVVLPPAASVVPMSDDVRAMAARAAGGGGRGEPITIQVMLDRRVLAEAVYDDAGDRTARR